MKPFWVLIILSLGVSCTVNSQPMMSKEGAMKNTDKSIVLFDGSPIWEEYKDLYDKIAQAQTSDAVHQLFNKGGALTTKMKDKVPVYQETVDDLRVLFISKTNGRLNGLSSNYGKRPRPDYLKRLRFVSARLQTENRLMNTFVKEKVTDTWVYSRIYEDMKHTQMEAASYIEYTNEEVTKDGKILSESDKNDLAEASMAISHSKAIMEIMEKGK
jgi:hypothetical protein